jgi:hypothetical protein
LADTAVAGSGAAGDASPAAASDVVASVDGAASPAPLAAGQYVCLPSKLRF